jgi:hypothetical protein
MSLADTPTPKAQAGTWTLTAPDGRTWQADSPLKCVSAELRERVPADIALARIEREIRTAQETPAECGECETKEHCKRPYGICVRATANRRVE